MFNQTKRSAENLLNSSHVSMVAAGTSIEGQINAEHDIRIDGKLIGNIFSKARVVIGEKGEVEGEIICNNAEIFGKVKGSVKVKEQLNLRESCIVEGDLTAAKVEMEPTAIFNGKFNIGSKLAEDRPEIRQIKARNVILEKETA